MAEKQNKEVSEKQKTKKTVSKRQSELVQTPAGLRSKRGSVVPGEKQSKSRGEHPESSGMNDNKARGETAGKKQVQWSQKQQLTQRYYLERMALRNFTRYG